MNRNRLSMAALAVSILGAVLVAAVVLSGSRASRHSYAIEDFGTNDSSRAAAQLELHKAAPDNRTLGKAYDAAKEGDAIGMAIGTGPLVNSRHASRHSRSALKHSDVVLSYPFAGPDVYEAYGVTVWGWGPEPAWAGDYARRIREAFDSGIRIVSSSINPSILPPPQTPFGRELITEPELKASVGINVEGKPIITPFWPVDYGKGVHAWWCCTNNPAFVENVRKRVVMGMEAGANAFHMDMPYGTAHMLDLGAGGCFCNCCLAGFREFLKNKYKPEELNRMGIEDVEQFDYRLMVSAVAGTVEAFNRAYHKGSVIPLIEDFALYQFVSASAFIKDMAALARKLGGEDIPVGGNCGGLRPKFLMAVDNFDYLVTEISHYDQPGHIAIVPYKLADALGKPLASWPTGPDVAHVQEGNLTGLLKTWIALSYALGGNMMVPHQLWTRTTTDGANWYRCKVEDYAFLYQFVRKYPYLFDNYEAVEQVGVVYDARSVRHGDRALGEMCSGLMNANIPFGLALAGDEFLNRNLTEEEVESRFKTIIVPQKRALEGEQARLVDQWIASGQAMVWEDEKSVISQLDPLVSIQSEHDVWAIPRTNRKQPDAPVVVHLINRRYDETTDTIESQSDIIIRVRLDALDGPEVLKAVLFSPNDEPCNIPFENGPDDVIIHVPRLDLWGVLRLECAGMPP